MFETFSHYLSYGASDQQTARDLRSSYNGLLVPGTIAAFHRDGTGGFVLSLSALPNPPDYVIDPRFPLFQQRLTNVKSAHRALAVVLGDSQLPLSTSDPQPFQFPTSRVASVSKAWADFNCSYQSSSSSKFDKYAARLSEPTAVSNAHGPRYVLPPYFMASSKRDPWWTLSKEFFNATVAAVGDRAECVRVVAATNVAALPSLLDDVSDDRVVIWVSNLEEQATSASELSQYVTAITNDQQNRSGMFALYGGFFSVLASAYGLCGSSHGIGFSEHRDYRELPTSGAPPARFYVPLIHKYVLPDEADLWHSADALLTACACHECHGRSPLQLDYHELMKHSVRCRAREISEWVGLQPQEMVARLNDESVRFSELLVNTGLANTVIAKARKHARHMAVWADALAIASP